MVLTPFVSGLTAPLYALKRKLIGHEDLQTVNLPKTGLYEHVVIAGGGRVGQHIAQVLTRLGVNFVIAESNYQRFIQCKAADFPVIYGDISQHAVLEAAKIDHARLFLITIPSIAVAQPVVRSVRQINPNMNIVARAEGEEQMKILYESGVYMVVMAELEAGLEIARQAMLHLQIPMTAIQQYTDRVRQKSYSAIYQENSDYHLLTQLKNAKDLLELTWIELPSESVMNGKTIQELNIRKSIGVSVVGVIRDGKFSPNPESGYCFTGGDMIAVIGNPKERGEFRIWAESKSLNDLLVKAKDFAAELTSHNVIEKDLSGQKKISEEHVENNQAVRNMLIERGVKPETLPPAEDVRKVQRKLESDEKKMLKDVKKKKR
jgi:CPA2 family monovalent cation:H+ antiporter-2